MSDTDGNRQNPAVPGKLEIGSGTTPRAGYVHLDIRDHLPFIDVRGDVCQLPFSAASIIEVLTVQTLEHLDLCDHQRAFAEFYRVIKPGGKLKICVPDMDWLCRQVLNRGEAYTTLLSWIFGGYSDSDISEMHHRSGFNEIYMRQCLGEMFSVVVLSTGRHGVNVEAIRL